MLARGAFQRLHVLGKAGTTVTGARIDEAVADARVGTDTMADHLDVGADALGDVRHFVHEADLRGQHGIGGVLGQLGRTHVHHHDAFVVAVERRVQALHQLQRRGVGGADHDAVRTHAILDGIAFLEEFGVRNHVERDVHAAFRQHFGDRVANLVGRADRHRGLVDDDDRTFQVAADRAGDRQHVLQVGAAVFVRRRTDGDEDDLAMFDRRGSIGGESDAPRRVVGQHHLFQARLVDRDDATIEAVDLGRVDVDADDLVAHLGEAGTGDQADIAGAENGYAHDGSADSCRAANGSPPRIIWRCRAIRLRRPGWRSDRFSAASRPDRSRGCPGSRTCTCCRPASGPRLPSNRE